MNKRYWAGAIGKAVACVALLGAGVVAMNVLAAMRREPAQAEIRERAIRVEVAAVEFSDVPVTIVGFGQARARDVVSVAAEVSGRVVQSHPRLEVGEIIPAGEVLFRVDPSDYQARYDEAQATVALWENTILRLERQHAIDKQRYKTLVRSLDLAVAEHERVKRLAVEDIGTQSLADQAEMTANTATDVADQMAQTLELYPIRNQEAQSNLRSAEAQADLARANLDRTVVRAPFHARVKDVDLETGQYVTPGTGVVTLADDALLEISVAIDSRRARDWLQFNHPAPGASNPKGHPAQARAWFGALSHVPVKVYWTEADQDSYWPGTLHRVEKFDQQTRTLTVVARIQGADAVSFQEGELPLVEGMFCRVEIPGRVAKNVVTLPAESVGFDRQSTGFRTVYVARESGDGSLRLRTAKVVESHVEGAFVYIASGLEAGERVITTRLVNPLENRLLDVAAEDEGKPAS